MSETGHSFDGAILVIDTSRWMPDEAEVREPVPSAAGVVNELLKSVYDSDGHTVIVRVSGNANEDERVRMERVRGHWFAEEDSFSGGRFLSEALRRLDARRTDESIYVFTLHEPRISDPPISSELAAMDDAYLLTRPDWVWMLFRQDVEGDIEMVDISNVADS